jgi:hypothetical protein
MTRDQQVKAALKLSKLPRDRYEAARASIENALAPVQFIPGTNVPKLRLAHIGPRTVAGFDDEVAELIEALRRERDKSAPRRSGSTAQRREVVP